MVPLEPERPCWRERSLQVAALRVRKYVSCQVATSARVSVQPHTYDDAR